MRCKEIKTKSCNLLTQKHVDIEQVSSFCNILLYLFGNDTFCLYERHVGYRCIQLECFPRACLSKPKT